MKIRFANKSDIEAIMNVEKASFVAGIQENQEVFEGRLESFGKGFVVFEDCDCVVGYLCSELWNDWDENALQLGHSAKNQHCDFGEILYLSSFALLPSFRGMGNGKKLFKEAIDFILENSNGIAEIFLLVNEQWQNAYHIYESFGFKTIKTIKNVFPKSNGILMKKEVVQ